ncbi:hypothetical protein Tco_1158732, partial [Tanacetum coccineum]
NAKRVPQGTNPEAKPRHKKHSTSSKQPFVSSKEATKGGSSKAPTGSKTSHLKRKKESSSAMDSNPSQTSVSTLVVAEMHKKDQQATGGPTSLGVTSEARANPHLSSVVSTTKADPGKSAPSTDPHVLADKTQYEDEASRTIKLEDLAKQVSSVQPSFKDLDSPEDDPIIVVDDSDKDEEADEVHATTNVETKDTLVPKSSSPSSLPTELKDLPSKFNELTEEVKGLKKQVHELEIELPEDLKEIPSKLEDFTKTVTRLTSQVVEMKTLQWELPAEFLSVPSQVEMAIESKKTRDTSVLSASQAGTQPAEEEKNLNQATISQWKAYPTEEQINQQKKIEEEAKAEAAKYESEDTLDKLNDLANKKSKHADDIHDYFKAKKGLSHQFSPGLDDHARTFSSLLLAEVDKRNLNPLKQMRVIEQLRQ